MTIDTSSDCFTRLFTFSGRPVGAARITLTTVSDRCGGIHREIYRIGFYRPQSGPLCTDQDVIDMADLAGANSPDRWSFQTPFPGLEPRFSVSDETLQDLRSRRNSFAAALADLITSYRA